jgi:hypothetical protein
MPPVTLRFRWRSKRWPEPSNTTSATSTTTTTTTTTTTMTRMVGTKTTWHIVSQRCVCLRLRASTHCHSTSDDCSAPPPPHSRWSRSPHRQLAPIKRLLIRRQHRRRRRRRRRQRRRQRQRPQPTCLKRRTLRTSTTMQLRTRVSADLLLRPSFAKDGVA